MSSTLPQSDTFELSIYKGNWYSEDYGFLLTISEQGLSLYDASSMSTDTTVAPYCMKKNIPTQQLAAELTYYKKINATTIQVATISGASHYTFQRVADDMVEQCQQYTKPSPVGTFKVFAELMETHYAFFDRYQVDWKARVAAHQGDITENTNDNTLYRTLTSMLVGIEDIHLSLVAELKSETHIHRLGRSRYLRPALDKAFKNQNTINNAKAFRANWYRQYKDNIQSQLLLNQANDNFDELIIWGEIGDLGYINLLRMTGFSDTGATVDEVKQARMVMDVVMSELKDSRVIVVDVTANGGGEDEVSRVFASYFTQQPRLAYQKQVYGSQALPQRFVITPAKAHVFNGTVVLVTSDHTVSAAEVFTLAMRAMPNVIHIGETSRGALSDSLDKVLPNGWQLALSNEIYLDAMGHGWEAVGIPPTKQVNIFRDESIHNSHLRAMTEIIQWVGAEVK